MNMQVFFLNTRLRQSKRTTILFLYFISLWKILKKLNIIKSETQFPTQKSLIDVVAVSSLLTIQCNTIILDVFNAINRSFSWSLSAKSMWRRTARGKLQKGELSPYLLTSDFSQVACLACWWLLQSLTSGTVWLFEIRLWKCLT